MLRIQTILLIGCLAIAAAMGVLAPSLLIRGAETGFGMLGPSKTVTFRDWLGAQTSTLTDPHPESANAASFVPWPDRPILHLAPKPGPAEPGDRRYLIQASSASGQQLFSLPDFCEPAWAAKGHLFACNARSKVLLGDSAGQIQTLVEAGPNASFYWYPAWSPDGDRIAVLLMTGSSRNQGPAWSLQIYDASTKQRLSSTALTPQPDAKFPMMAGFPFTMFAPDKFVWSPDGRYILMSWGFASLFDVKSGKIKLVSPDAIMADWDRQGQLWALEIVMQEGPTFNGLYRIDPDTLEKVRMASKAQLDAEGLSFTFVIAELVTSPSGNRMALHAAKRNLPQPELGSDVVQIYDISDPAKFDISAPLEVARSTRLLQLAWSPDEKFLALSRLVPGGKVGAISVDIVDPDAARQPVHLSSFQLNDMFDAEGLATVRHVAWAR